MRKEITKLTNILHELRHRKEQLSKIMEEVQYPSEQVKLKDGITKLGKVMEDVEGALGEVKQNWKTDSHIKK